MPPNAGDRMLMVSLVMGTRQEEVMIRMRCQIISPLSTLELLSKSTTSDPSGTQPASSTSTLEPNVGETMIMVSLGMRTPSLEGMGLMKWEIICQISMLGVEELSSPSNQASTMFVPS